MSDPLVKVFVSAEGDEWNGILVLHVSNAEAEIMGIAVSEHFRNQGIGIQTVRMSVITVFCNERIS